jgi:hypothetical protein
MQNSAIPPLIRIVTSPYILLPETVFRDLLLNLNSICIVTVLDVGRIERNTLVSFHVIRAMIRLNDA